MSYVPFLHLPLPLLRHLQPLSIEDHEMGTLSNHGYPDELRGMKSSVPLGHPAARIYSWDVADLEGKQVKVSWSG